MRYSIFKKAELLKDKVILEVESINKAYFDVDGIKICLVHNEKYTYLESCCCKSHSIHGGITDMKNLCAYILALYKKLPELEIKN